jgi:hypothetical protein
VIEVFNSSLLSVFAIFKPVLYHTMEQCNMNESKSSTATSTSAGVKYNEERQFIKNKASRPWSSVTRSITSRLRRCGRAARFVVVTGLTRPLSSRGVEVLASVVLLVLSLPVLLYYNLRKAYVLVAAKQKFGGRATLVDGMDYVFSLDRFSGDPGAALTTVVKVDKLPSGGLTLILGTQKCGFSGKVQRRPPANLFLNESLPPKTPLRTPCSWPPWPWFSREKSLKIFKVL